MKNVGDLILEYRPNGKVGGTGDVYIHVGTSAERIYSGPAGFALYEMMKQFIRARHAGSGDWFEQDTEHGKQWRERRISDVHYEKLEESA
jgi:hypothetical protein